MSDSCKRRGDEPLTQDIFKDAPDCIDIAIVNYDSSLRFGIKGTNFRFAYNAGQYRGYEQIGETIQDTVYRPEQSLTRIFE